MLSSAIVISGDNVQGGRAKGREKGEMKGG
jgi:hypothetical protein